MFLFSFSLIFSRSVSDGLPAKTFGSRFLGFVVCEIPCWFFSEGFEHEASWQWLAGSNPDSCVICPLAVFVQICMCMHVKGSGSIPNSPVNFCCFFLVFGDKSQ